VRGQGAPLRGGGRGDLLVRVLVKVPRDGGAAAIDAARALERFYERDPRADLRF
jgi:DnaJ-class molecular chaperone